MRTEHATHTHTVRNKQVLRFYGFFKESVVESNIENHRVRKVILYYYLEDDSMHIAEPRQDNSGIPQVRALNAGRRAEQQAAAARFIARTHTPCTEPRVHAFEGFEGAAIACMHALTPNHLPPWLLPFPRVSLSSATSLQRTSLAASSRPRTSPWVERSPSMAAPTTL